MQKGTVLRFKSGNMKTDDSLCCERDDSLVVEVKCRLRNRKLSQQTRQVIGGREFALGAGGQRRPRGGKEHHQ